MVDHNQTVAVTVRAQWVFHNIHRYQFPRATTDDWLQRSSSCRNWVFPPLAWQAVLTPFLYVQRHMRPEKPLLHPRRSLGSTKMAQVIVQHLKNSRSKTKGNNYLSRARVLNATTSKDTVLPHTQVGPLLNKSPELHVVYAFRRGSFRPQQRLDLGKCWATVLLLSDKVKGPCFLCNSPHSLDST